MRAKQGLLQKLKKLSCRLPEGFTLQFRGEWHLYSDDVFFKHIHEVLSLDVPPKIVEHAVDSVLFKLNQERGRLWNQKPKPRKREKSPWMGQY